jgi:periplasmic protein TonB
MSAVANAPQIHPSDRLGMTLFVAVIVHAIIVLGITFQPELTRLPSIKSPPIEIKLVHQTSDEKPEDAEVLAQTSLEGGGELERPESPQSPAFTPVNPQRLGADSQITRPAAPPPPEQPPETRPLTQLRSDLAAVTPPEVDPETERQPLTAEELIARSMEIATLSAEISQAMTEYAQRGQHRFISARTREFRDAVYLDAWRAKIERIGNLNYPEEAKRRNLSGNLLLDVAINADGSLHSVTLLRSSGHKVLDDAALRIVHLSAPFAPFSEEMKKDTDVLHITRNWEFLDSHSLSARR